MHNWEFVSDLIARLEEPELADGRWTVTDVIDAIACRMNDLEYKLYEANRKLNARVESRVSRAMERCPTHSEPE